MTPDARACRPAKPLFCAIALAALRVAVQLLAAGPGGAFNPYGLNAAVAWVALDVAVAALFVRPAARTTALSAMLMLSDRRRTGDQWPSSRPRSGPLSCGGEHSFSRSRRGADRDVCRCVAVVDRRHGRGIAQFRGAAAACALGRVAALWVALLAVSALVPHAPVFVARNFDIRTANLWESLSAQFAALKKARRRVAGFEQSAAVAAAGGNREPLPPPTKGTTNIYALGIAGWADQDVFLKGARRRPGCARRRAADPRSRGAPGQSSRNARKPAARRTNAISPPRCMRLPKSWTRTRTSFCF